MDQLQRLRELESSSLRSSSTHEITREIHSSLLAQFGRTYIEEDELEEEEEEKEQEMVQQRQRKYRQQQKVSTSSSSSTRCFFQAQLKLTSSSSSLTSSVGITESLVASACVDPQQQQQSTSSAIFHLLVTNPSRDSIPTPNGSMHLRLSLTFIKSPYLLQDAANLATNHQLSFTTPFPSARWNSTSRIHLPVAIDSRLLDAHQIHARVSLCVKADVSESGCEDFDLLIDEWLVDLLDATSLVPSRASESLAHSTPHKRKRNEKAEEKSSSLQHESKRRAQTVLLSSSPSHVPAYSHTPPSLFGCLYSTPQWYAAFLNSSLAQPKSPQQQQYQLSSSSSSHSFQFDFLLPLLLLNDSKKSEHTISLMTGHLIRHLVQSLMSVHSTTMKDIDQVLRELLATSAASVAPATSPLTFQLMLHDLSVDFIIDMKSVGQTNASAAATATTTGTSSPRPALFTLHINAPRHSAATFLQLRLSILKRLQMVLFGTAASSSSPWSRLRSSNGDAASHPILPPLKLRQMSLTLSDARTTAQEIEKDAFDWLAKYLALARQVAAIAVAEAEVDSPYDAQEKSNGASNHARLPHRNGVSSIFATPLKQETINTIHQVHQQLEQQINHLRGMKERIAQIAREVQANAIVEMIHIDHRMRDRILS